MQRRIVGAVAFLLFVFFISASLERNALAQTSGGTIAGTVSDPTGAVVPNAIVVATGADTGSVYSTVTTSAGLIRFPQMQLGRYDVKVTAVGFKTTTLSGILVTTGNVSPAEVRLETGGSSEAVNVDSDAPVVETENSEVSGTISNRQIVDLPLSLGGQSAMRSVESFIFLTPGTVGPGTASTTSTSGAFQAKTAGGQNFGTEELLDGINVRRLDSDSAFDEHAPGVEALTELKVTTSIIPATEGRTTGGVENFSTRSGTNQYHGTVFDIFQNEDLNANDYFNKLRIAQNPGNSAVAIANQRPLDKKNDYGGSIGGPIAIPHIYNGHDKTFGFFNWEQFRQSESGVAVSSIPTAAQHGGDFSAQFLLDAAGNRIPDGTNIDCTGAIAYEGEIFDPATTATVFNPNAGGSGQGATVPCRNPFPNNTIPTARFSTVATNALKYYPLPNTGTATQTINNYSYSTSFPLLNTVYTIRVDHNISDKSKIFVTYTDRDNDITNGHPPYPGPGGGVQIQHAFAKYLRAGSDYTISDKQFNHFVAGLTRLYQLNTSNSVGIVPDWDAALGIIGLSGPNIAPFSFSANPSGIAYNGIGYANDAVQPVSGVEFADTYTVNRGRHTLNFGVDFRKDQFTNGSFGSESGTFGFAQFETGATPNDTLSGDPYASFLLGNVDSSSAAVQSRAPRISQLYYAAFVQDDFKVTHNLLLNLGLRWDVDEPRNEAHGNFSNFSPTLPNAGAGGRPGSLYFAGVGPGRTGSSGEFAKIYRKDFAPRIGFAYAPKNSMGTTSIRGGFGIYYGPLDYADFGSANQIGFTASPNFSSPDKFTTAFCNRTATSTSNNCATSTGSLDAGFPTFAPPPNLDPTQSNGQVLGGQLNSQYIAPGFGRPAAIYNWGAQVQQQFATDLIFTLGYIGTTGTFLHSNLAQINDLNPAFFSYGKTALNQSYAATPSVAAPYAGFSGNLNQALRPFPQYLDIYSDGGIENLGHSHYEALTASLERRFHNGLNLLAAYTWSKTITDSDSVLPAFSSFNGGPGSVQNPYNLKSEKALSFQDVPQNFVVSYIYELPLGKGKKFLNNHAAVNAIVGGFQVGGIDRYLSGTPTAFSCTPTSVGASLACLRYDITSNFVDHGQQPKDPTVRHVFNSAAFSDPSAGDTIQLGTSPRVNGGYRTPIYKNEDFSITKQLAAFGEHGGNLQLHVDLFNAFNRVHFSAPNTNPNDNPGDGSPGHFGSYNGDFGQPTVRQFILRYSF